MTVTPTVAQRLTLISLVALITLCVSWELWLAPLRPGGSWLVLKAFPLLAPLGGLVAGRRYTYQWTSLLILAYLAEGAVRATSDPGMSRYLAMVETGLALMLFASVVAYVRLTRRPR